MAKWTLPLDSARQIGASTISKGKLMVVGNMFWVGFENPKIGIIFACRERTNRWYSQWMLPLDSAYQVGFIYDVKRNANDSWETCYWGPSKIGKSATFLLAEKEPTVLRLNGRCRWIRRVK